MTIFEAIGIGTFLYLIFKPSQSRDSQGNIIGTCMLSLLWPVFWIYIGYQFVKIKVFKGQLAELGSGTPYDPDGVPPSLLGAVEFVGAALAAVVFIVLSNGFFKQPISVLW